MYKPTHISAASPTVNDDYDDGFREGNFWRDTGTPDLLLLVDETVGAADWDTVLAGGSLAEWGDWTPGFTWTGDQPTGVTAIARFCEIGNTVWFTLQVSGRSGAGGTGVTNMSCTLPRVVAYNNSHIPCASIGDNVSVRWSQEHLAVIDTSVDPGIMVHLLFVAIDSGDDFTLYYSGFYEKI